MQQSMYELLYTLYIDESGDEGVFDISKYNNKDGSSRYFTLGGIIVHHENTSYFNNELENIKNDFFNHISNKNFKLHYVDLRNQWGVFEGMNKIPRYNISNRIFDAVKSIDCNLLFITIDLHNHRIKYKNPVLPRVYSLLLMKGWFQYFLEDRNDIGKIIYERYDTQFKKRVDFGQNFLNSHNSFPNLTNFSNIYGEIINGDPLLEPILQFVDFTAYPPYIKRWSNGKDVKRYEEIKYKYYNFDHQYQTRRGNVEL